MFLKKVTVNNFRALQDVSLSFDPSFYPSIFPLGSLNGGGKSTFLQLIFILHCALYPEKHEYIADLLPHQPKQSARA